MLSKFSVRKPYTVIVGVVLVLILGVVSFMNMTTDLLPSINLPYALVMTTYPGASPEEVETVVSKPVEQAMASVSNIENIQSISAESMSMVILEFSQTTNMDSVSLEMRESLDQISAFWSDSVGNPIIMKLNPDMLPVMIAAVEQDDMNSVEITNLMEDELLSELESLEGVASVSTSGEVEESVQVIIRQDKIDGVNNKITDALGLTFADARKELADAQAELDDAQAELDSGKAQMEDGKNQMASQLSGAKSELQSKQLEVLKGEIDLENGLSQIEEQEAELAAAEAELTAQEEQLLQAEQAKTELPGKLEELNAQKAQLEAGLNAIEELKSSPVYAGYLEQKEDLEEAESRLAQLRESGASEEDIRMQEAIVEGLKSQVELIEAQFAAQFGSLGLVSFTEEALDGVIAQLQGNLALIESGIAQIQEAQAQLPDEETIAAGKAQLAAGKEQIADGKAQLAAAKEQITGAMEQIASGKLTMEQALAMLNQQEIAATIEMAAAQAQLASGQTQLDAGKEQLDAGREELEEQEEQALEGAKLDDKITPEMVSQILMAQNFSMPAGYVTEEGIQYLVRVGDKFADTADMENLILFDMGLDDLDPIRLSDVAEVVTTDNSSEVYARINGKPAILVTMQKQTGYSTGEVSDRIKERFEKLMEEIEGLHITPLMDQGIYIDFVVDSVLNNLLSGAVLAILILFLFLKNIRPTAVVACSIPISVLGAVVLMYFSGISLNVISLSGLALGVGMLVDNSIVVIENIYRLRSLGVPIRKAAVQGARQVSGAIIASTLTTVCVFLPIVFTEGITRQLFVDMGLTIGYSLMASLAVALTLVPTMSVGLLKKNDDKKHPLLDRMTSAYEKIMGPVLRMKVLVLLGATVLLVLSFVLAVKKGTAFMPDMESTQTSISLTMPEGTSTEETGAMADEVMARLEDLEDIEEMGAMTGGSSALASLEGGGSTNTASIYLILSEEKKMTGQELSEEIVRRTEDLDCELQVSTNNMDMSALGGSGIQIQIKGKEMDTLQRIARDVAGILEETEGLEQVSDGMEETTTELRLVIDKAAAMEHNLTVAQVYQQIQAKLAESSSATTLSTESKDYDVVVIDEEQTQYTRDDVRDFTVSATDQEGNTEEIPLEDIAEFQDAEGPDTIQRRNQSRYLNVSAAVSDGYNIGLLGNEVQEKLDDYEVPDGYSVEMAGEDETIQEAMREVMKMMGLAIVFIYLIMVAQFQSLLSPFIVMFTIPLAFTGGFFGLVAANQEVSVIALIGFVMLCGIIVNNGIVLVDYINQLRAAGMEKRQAIIQAGRTRMRPILMTALTTILGLSTMSMGVGMGSDMVQPMAIVTIGGLLYGTVLTLFVVPCVYDILNRKEYHSEEDDELGDSDYIPETVDGKEGI